MSTPAGDGLVGDASIRVDADTDPALRALRGFSRDVQGRIRDISGRFVAEGTVINRSLTTAAGGGDRFGGALQGLTSIAGGAASALGRIGASMGTVAAGAGAAVPVVAGLAAAAANIAPAAGLAATGMFAVAQASAALKLGMIGVEDAITAALDPSKAAEFDEALKKLSPNARAFAEQVKALQPAFQSLQQSVQDRLFAGLDGVLKSMASSTLPVLRAGLLDSADSLNAMGKGVGAAAISLGESGTLGTAIAGANAGLRNLSGVPGQLVTALTQVGAAAAPAFGRLTASAGTALGGLSDKFSAAFESGAMQQSIETAIGLIGQLANVAGNVFSVIGSVFSAAQVSGGGFIGTLQQITGALAAAFASPGVQEGLRAIFSTMATAAQTVAPLLVSALQTIAPVFAELGPPVQTLIKALGAALGPVIEALGPVLASAAQAVGSLLTSFAPLLPVIGELVAALLPALTPILDAVNKVFVALAPIVAKVAGILVSTLSPIITSLTPIIGTLAKMIGDQLVLFLGVLGDLVTELGPSLASIGRTFGVLFTAVAPLVQTVAKLGTELLTKLMPVITPLIKLIGDLAAIFAEELATVIKSVVIPAIDLVVAILSGDFAGAWNAAKRLVSGAVSTIIRWLTELPAKAWGALSSFGSRLGQRAKEAGSALVAAISAKVSEAVTWVRGLPGRAWNALSSLGARLRDRAVAAGVALVTSLRERISSAVQVVRDLPGRAASALGNLGSRLYNSGRALISGFISGILSRLSDVASAAGRIAAKAREFFPGSPAKEGPFSGRGWVLYSGRAIGESLAQGLAQREALVRRAAQMVAQTAQQAVTGPTVAVPMAAGPLGMGAALEVGAVRTGMTPSTPTTVSLTVNLTNAGVIGSQREVENWLAGAIDNLRLQGRLA